MEAVDTNSREMDPLIFGSLFHDTVQTIKGWKFDAKTSATELSGHLQNELQRQIAQRFGKTLSFALRLQEEALLARLRAFADRQIESVAQGGAFEVIATEEAFTIPLECGVINGRIDRIDQLADGSLRLIDYKTSDTAKTPLRAHLKGVGKKGPAPFLPEAAFVMIGSKEYQWTDLQLPLYAAAKGKATGVIVRPAYFNLPKSRDKAGLEPFDELSPELIDAALRCASAVAQEIQAGHFWPPNPDLPEEYDDFARLFPDGLEGAVDAEAFASFNYAEEVPT